MHHKVHGGHKVSSWFSTTCFVSVVYFVVNNSSEFYGMENRDTPNPPDWLRWGYAALFGLLPWSVEVPFGAWKMSVPAEPLTLFLGIGLVVAGVRFESLKRTFQQSLLLKISVLWIFWLLAATCFSTMPSVSAKYFVVTAGQFWVFFGGMVLFPSLWPLCLRWLSVSMLGMVVFALVQHSFYGFRPDQSNLAPMPFFADHTVYAAVLAAGCWKLEIGNWKLEGPNPRFPISQFPNFQFPISNSLLLVGLYFSFCRAAWLSAVLAGVLGGLLVFWAYRRWLALAAGVAVGLLFFQWGKIADPATDGNARDLSRQLRSLANVTTDASNLERLNRYSCALRMTADRPVLGFGPGTFQFQYLAYQRPEEMTRISVTQPITDRNPSNYGRGGGAHSEYLQALAEAGLPGFLLWIGLVAASLAAGIRAFFRTENTAVRGQMLAVTMSLTTFFVHGLFNNFLHDGRVAALIWGQVALLAGFNFSEKYPATRPPNPGTEI